MQLNGSQIFVEVLCEQGVDTIFGYPGGAVLNLYDELYQNADRITHVLTAHEQGASHAADGYARATGRTGVVLATSGPGATNLVTGIATAYMDSVPMVAFTGNVATPGIGKDCFQEAYIAVSYTHLVDGEDQDRHLIDMPHSAFAAVPPEHVADFMAKYGHLNLNWMQVGAKNADGYCFYDIVRGGMDKGVGLTDLCARLDLPLEETVAAGDSANDLSMLRTAGLGVCMDNGTEDAKAAADRVIGDVREDGLAALIEELWFNGPKAEPSGRDLGSAWAQIESAGGQ